MNYIVDPNLGGGLQIDWWIKVANPKSQSWSLGVRPSSQLRRKQSALLLFSATNPPFLRLKTVMRYLISLKGPPPNARKSSFGQSKWESSFRSLMSTKPLDQTVSPLLYSEMLQLNSLLPLLDFSSCASTKNICRHSGRWRIWFHASRRVTNIL